MILMARPVSAVMASTMAAVSRGIVVQAQDDQIHTGNQSALGGRVLAQSGSMLTSSTPANPAGVHGSADPWFRLRHR
jgi:hypothetical protein